MSRLSPAHLRMAGLGTAVAIAVLVPLAAKAGESGGTPPKAAPPASADAKPGGGPDAAGDGTVGELLGDLGLGREARTPGSVPSAPAAPAAAVRGKDAVASAEAPERVSRCGPEVASPEGVEAQTCVLSEGPDVWARTYYRNATGREIDAILTLMAPGGRTVQVRCAVPARDEPDTCETPREPGAGAATSYTAVAEFAGNDEGGDAPLLLRSGSNTADEEAS
ncbi:hypothetical protein [Streptomyces hydrogenans]|uniref:hypothetical protein n=1 Tax=Streptomyces hydrogenans TaxID=1873719 RepID=UPI00341A07C0